MATGLSLGTLIRRARERKRWTQQQLADAVGKGVRTVNDWENGRTSPRSSIGALEDVLGISLSEPGVPHISPELRQMIEALSDDEREWVLSQLNAVTAPNGEPGRPESAAG
jgi:transcriptional regulator with XRE-family HTH domain